VPRANRYHIPVLHHEFRTRNQSAKPRQHISVETNQLIGNNLDRSDPNPSLSVGFRLMTGLASWWMAVVGRVGDGLCLVVHTSRRSHFQAGTMLMVMPPSASTWRSSLYVTTVA